MTNICDIQWLKRCKSTLFLLLIGSVVISGQNQSNRFFSSGTEIVVDVLPGNDIYYSHPCDQGINIYNLAEVFQVNAEMLLKENKINPKNPKYDGKIVKIPIKRTTLVTNPNFKQTKHAHIKVRYKVKKGDNLFRISKDYFDTDLEAIKSLNNKKTNDVKIGEELLVGWLLLNDKPTKTFISKEQGIVKEKMQPKKIEPKTQSEPKVVAEPSKVDKKEVENSDDVKIIKYYLSDVIGFWDKSTVNTKSYFVLHNEAKPGTMMDVYNPMLKTHIKAKVLGKIPSGTYAEDIQIIISPSVAKDLRILDGRFKVNIKYEQ
jgi:LysM repeat protein